VASSDDPMLSWEYQTIAAHYEQRTAARSGVLLLQHIDHGLKILRARNASAIAQRAFCLHPLLQSDEDFVRHHVAIQAVAAPEIYSLAIEYRRVANAALSDRKLTSPEQIELSANADVNEMLVADKVQNRNDFQRYHAGRHPRSEILALYFELWLQRLGITATQYAQLVTLLA
jgi:hypothetical protein